LHLTIDSEYEKPIKNTGDFSGQLSASAGFPIGEIFTEATDLSAIQGELMVFGFPGLDHLTKFVEPFSVRIANGKVVSHTGPAGFQEMIDMIQRDEPGDVQIREIGFGLNRGLSFSKRITEPTGFERFAGMHFSLGLKHDMYRKKLRKTVVQKYHVDMFCLVSRVTIGGVVVFENGGYVG
jgi:aminopeptidase